MSRREPSVRRPGRRQSAPGPSSGDPLARLVLRAADAAASWASRRLAGTAESVAPPVTRPRAGLTSAGLRGLDRDGEELRIINDVFAAGARRIGEVMVPRTEVHFLDGRLPVPRAVHLVRDARHSRFPVVDGGPDEVLGFVHLRDLLSAAFTAMDGGSATVAGVVRDIARLPASKPILAALADMRRDGQHLALVVDEYGGTAGIVTLEDLIEELVGEIRDEYDPTPEPPPVAGVPAAEVDGRLNLADFAEVTGVALPLGPYETVGGYLMARLGRLPAAGDEVAVADGAHRLVVAAVEGRRVARVLVDPVPVPGQRAR